MKMLNVKLTSLREFFSVMLFGIFVSQRFFNAKHLLTYYDLVALEKKTSISLFSNGS
jgi:hypothetical protein